MKKAFKALSMLAVVATIAGLSLVSGCSSCCDSPCDSPCETKCDPCPQPCDPCGTGADWGYSHGGAR